MITTIAKKDFWDYLIGLSKYRNYIIINFLFFLIVTYIIALFLPKWYEAEVVLLPPKQNIPFGVSALSSSLPFSSLGLGFGDDNINVYISILESKNIRYTIVKQKGLETVYNVDRHEEAVLALGKNTDILIGNEGTIEVSVLDQSAERAAEIANLYAYLLDSLFTQFATQKAHFNRIFLENQLNETKISLKDAETDLEAFQLKNGAISLPAQIEATIKAAGELIARKFALEIELELKEGSLSDTHPDILSLKQNIQSIDDKLKSLKENDAVIESVLLPFNSLPNLSLNYARLFREVEIQNKLYAIIYQQFQQARIEEAKDTPSIQILDVAIPPYKRSKPKRVIIAAVSAISTTIILLLSLLFAIHLNFLQELDEERYHKIISFFSRSFSIKSTN